MTLAVLGTPRRSINYSPCIDLEHFGIQSSFSVVSLVSLVFRSLF